MKQTIKILFFVSIGLLIGYFIADFSLENEAEISNPEKAETIVELMGTETTFGVKGNCKMCKKTIETAALSLDGVHKAVWDVETKQIDLVYDDQLVELMTIHNTIANSGYSTELVDLNKEAYDNLPMCCQYNPEK
jgi:mercuric ion binding protein